MSVSILTITLNPAIDRLVEVEALEPGGHVRARTVLRVAGGKGVNVARVLAAKGVGCAATGFLGRQNAGLFEDAFAELGIEDRFIRIDGYTRENVTIVERQTHRDTHLRDEGPTVSREAWQQLQAGVAKWLDGQESGAIAAVCGSLPPGVSPEDACGLLAEIHSRGSRVILDTSGEFLARAVERGGLWLIKPNAAELAGLVGRTEPSLEELPELAESLLGRVELVLLSLGADGAMLIARDSALHARSALPANRAVRNTVGCGDTLVGAYLAAHCSGSEPMDALRSATATATAAAAHPATALFDPALAGEMESSVKLAAFTS